MIFVQERFDYYSRYFFWKIGCCANFFIFWTQLICDLLSLLTGGGDGTSEFIVGTTVASSFPFPATTVGCALSLPFPLKRNVSQQPVDRRVRGRSGSLSIASIYWQGARPLRGACGWHGRWHRIKELRWTSLSKS